MDFAEAKSAEELRQISEKENIEEWNRLPEVLSHMMPQPFVTLRGCGLRRRKELSPVAYADLHR